MAKRRTRKQKERAKHQFTLSWEPSTSITKPKAKTSSNRATVKGQIKKPSSSTKSEPNRSKIASITAKDKSLASIKKDLAKSLVIASLILSMIVMIYLIW